MLPCPKFVSYVLPKRGILPLRILVSFFWIWERLEIWWHSDRDFDIMTTAARRAAVIKIWKQTWILVCVTCRLKTYFLLHNKYHPTQPFLWKNRYWKVAQYLCNNNTIQNDQLQSILHFNGMWSNPWKPKLFSDHHILQIYLKTITPYINKKFQWKFK